MNREDVIRLVRENGFGLIDDDIDDDLIDYFERFAALVAATEREACAKICDENVKFWKSCPDRRAAEGSRICGEEIRARGQE